MKVARQIGHNNVENLEEGLERSVTKPELRSQQLCKRLGMAAGALATLVLRVEDRRRVGFPGCQRSRER